MSTIDKVAVPDDREYLIALAKEQAADIAQLRAEVARMRPVIEAANRWQANPRGGGDVENALGRAVVQYRGETTYPKEPDPERMVCTCGHLKLHHVLPGCVVRNPPGEKGLDCTCLEFQAMVTSKRVCTCGHSAIHHTRAGLGECCQADCGCGIFDLNPGVLTR